MAPPRRTVGFRVAGRGDRLSVLLRAPLGVVRAASRVASGPRDTARTLVEFTRRTAAFDERVGPPKLVRAGGHWFFRPMVPRWPGPVFDRWLEAQLREHTADGPTDPPYLTAVFLAVTVRCPLHCAHCSASAELGEEEALDLGGLRDLVRRLQEGGVGVFHLTGGEPMVRFDDVVALIQEFGDRSDFWVDTSGVGLDERKAHALREAGAAGVFVSLDHWDEAQHDAFRGADNTYSWATRAVRACVDADLPVGLSLCVVRDLANADDLHRYARLARDLGAFCIRLVEPRPAGRWAGQDVRLRPAEIGAVEAVVEELNQGPERRDWPVVFHDGWLQRRVGCQGAGNRSIYIDSRGMVRPCPFCSGDAGSLLDRPLSDALDALQSAGCSAFGPPVAPRRRPER